MSSIDSLVSIIIPVFNASKTFARAVKSLLAQDYTNWEAIVVDDGSTEDIESICKSFKDSRIKFHKLNQNYGRGYARQFALEKCTGEFIGFLDADDWYLPTKLSRQIEIFKKQIDVNIVSCNLTSYDASGKCVGDLKFPESKSAIYTRPSASLPIPFASTLIRATLAKKNKFETSLREVEDYDYLLKNLLNEKYVLINDALYAYEQDEKLTLRKISARLSLTEKVLINYFVRFPFAVLKSILTIKIKKVVYGLIEILGIQGLVKFKIKNSKKVLVTCHSVNFYYRFVDKFVDEYKSNGYDVTTVVYSRKKENADLDITNINTEVSLNPLATAFRLILFAKTLITIRPNIIHTNITLGSFIPLLCGFIFRVPTRIYHNHGFGFLGHTGFARLALKFVEKMNCYLSTQVITVSRSNLSMALSEKIVEENKIRILGAGSAVGIVNNQKFRLRDSAKMNIGYVGRPHYRKGFFDLLKAWRESGLSAQGFFLHIAGCSHDDVKKFGFIDVKNVVCHGYVDNMDTFYSNICVLLLPSYHEGFGQCIIEAAQYGIPAVASDIPGITCAVDHQKTGLLHIPGDIAKIIEYTKLLLSDTNLRSKLGENARVKATREFSRAEILNAFKKDFLKAS